MKFKDRISSSITKINVIDDDQISVRDLIQHGYRSEHALCMHGKDGVVYLLMEENGIEKWLKLKYN